VFNCAIYLTRHNSCMCTCVTWLIPYIIYLTKYQFTHSHNWAIKFARICHYILSFVTFKNNENISREIFIFGCCWFPTNNANFNILHDETKNLWSPLFLTEFDCMLKIDVWKKCWEWTWQTEVISLFSLQFLVCLVFNSINLEFLIWTQ